MSKPVMTSAAKPVLVSKVEQAEQFAKGDKAEAGQTLRLNANIPAELHTALKIRAAREGKTMAVLIEDWIRSWHK